MRKIKNTQKEPLCITASTGRNHDCDSKKEHSVVTNELLSCFYNQPEMRDTKFIQSSKDKLDNNCLTSD